MPVQLGDVLVGKYRVESILGAGGMGVVVAATHLQLGQRVALKFLIPERLGNEEAVQRFLREARASAQIQSEHVARVVDVGTLETGSPYMVMEYLVGSDLSQLLAQNGCFPIADAVDYLLQACVGVAEAHALGIVHRDLKPANLFVARRSDGAGIVKVLDFGISKAAATDDQQAALTKTSALMGSPLYMAPEQMKASRSVDSRADIWALGVVLYELVAGRPPFTGDTLPEVCAAILAATAQPLSTLRPDVSAEFESVVSRCLEKEPEERFADVVELASALLPFAGKRSHVFAERASRVFAAHGMTTTATGMGPAPSTVPRPAPQPASSGTVVSWSETQPQPRSSRGLLVATVVGAVAVAGVGVGWAALRPAASAAASGSAAPTDTVPALRSASPTRTSAPTSSSEVPPAPALSASASAAVPKERPVPKKEATRKAEPQHAEAAKPKPGVSAAPTPAPTPAPTVKKSPLSVDIK